MADNQPQESSPVDFPYQTVGFHFKVTFEGLGVGDEDVRFQSVSGLDVEKETETWKEGGENHFEHTMPGRTKFSSPLILKRGLLMPGKSKLTDWCIDAFVHFKLKPLETVTVQLLNEEHEVLAKWDLAWVWPRSWKLAELNAERSEVLIETLELNFNRLVFKNP